MDSIKTTIKTDTMSDILEKLDSATLIALTSISPEANELVESNRSNNPHWKEKVEKLLMSTLPRLDSDMQLKSKHIGWKIVHDRLKHEIETLSAQDKSRNIDDLLIAMAKQGHLNEVNILIEAGANPASDNNLAFILAVVNERNNVVAFLLKNRKVDPTVNNNQAYKIATKNGFYRIIALLEEHPKVIKTL